MALTHPPSEVHPCGDHAIDLAVTLGSWAMRRGSKEGLDRSGGGKGWIRKVVHVFLILKFCLFIFSFSLLCIWNRRGVLEGNMISKLY